MKKTNKTFKRFAAITSASLLAACAVIPAVSFAATLGANETGRTIEINGWNTTGNNDNAAHTLEAYQVFKGDLDSTGKILTNVDFGDGITPATLSQKLVEASTTEGHVLNGLFPQLTNDDGNRDYTAKEIVDILNSKTDETAVFAFDAATTKAFAAIVAECLTNVKSGSYTAASGENKAKISDLPVGYYLIQDASITSEEGAENTGAKTRYILQLTEADATINIKASAPTVMKKVYENADDNLTGVGYATIGNMTETENAWNDVADYNIGDEVPFKLYGTMPSTLEDYDHYYYCFNDTLAKQFNKPSAVKVTIGETVLEFAHGEDGYTLALGTDYDDNCSIAYNEESGALTVEFKDIKVYPNISTSTVVTVEYKSELNSSAYIGLDGQENEVYLSYSNNPNQDYNPWDENEENDEHDDGNTKVDKVIVFTYGIDVDKVDQADKSQLLTGAEFKLYNADKTKSAKVEDNKITGWVNGAEGTTLTGGTIKIAGLDDGTYYLHEIKSPDGYNLPTGEAAYFEIKVNATTGNTQSWDETPSSALTALASDLDETKDWYVDAQITNSKGTSLPGTGGIGTTIFYLGGGAMAAIGGVYLISKRRMKKSEE